MNGSEGDKFLFKMSEFNCNKKPLKFECMYQFENTLCGTLDNVGKLLF
jgi:hypothetical protein